MSIDNFNKKLTDAKGGVTSEEIYPKVLATGYLKQFGEDLEVLNLSNGQRVFRLSNMVFALRGKNHGKFANYLDPTNIRKFLPERLWPNDGRERTASGITIASFNNKLIKTYDADDFIDICLAFTDLRDSGQKLSEAQIEIATRSRQFLRATAKIGITALIDEATGYQYIRGNTDLSLKLNFLLADALQKWEKTFPDSFWVELGRLTQWKGSIKQRPKYWGKLVNELIYDNIDKDTALWLRENVPPKLTGQKYHQWLKQEVRVTTLTNHINQTIGMMYGCKSLDELRAKMYERFNGDIFLPLGL
jgi:P63C domain